MKYTTMIAFGGVLAAMPLGCATDKTVDLGTNAGSALSDYSGSWDGYAEAFTFDSGGSDRVRITLDATGHGTIRLGDASLLAPPTDPTSAFPPDQSLNSETGLWSGVELPLYDGRVDGDRVRLAANPDDAYKPWCEIQIPVATSQSPSGYGCVVQRLEITSGVCFVSGYEGLFDGGADGGADGGTDDGTLGANCRQLGLCSRSQLCTCTASGCGLMAPAAGTAPVKIDGALESGGVSLVGTLLLGVNRVTIRLQKQ